MKKRNLWHSLTSMIAAMALCLSLPLSVLAEEGTVQVETTAGNPEAVNVNITIEKTTKSDGSTQTDTTASAQNQVTDSGMTVDYNGQSSMNTPRRREQ